MAQNVRGDRVVDPRYVAEYDRISQNAPFIVLLVGVILFAASTVLVLTLPVGIMMLLGSVLGFVVLVATLLHAMRLGLEGTARREHISRDLWPLRSVAVFDEAAAADLAIWDAAGLALELEALDDANERLSSALARTPEQERELDAYERERLDIAARVLDLVTPQTV